MHISAMRVANFRRLHDVLIDLAEDISILVGSNNSGKTSTAHVLELFVVQEEKFSIHDFNSESWSAMNDVGDGMAAALMPRISVDIWFSVAQADLHRVIDVMPRLNWQGSEVGIRIEYVAKDLPGLVERFTEARAKAQEHIKYKEDGTVAFHPSPRTMYDYLVGNLNDEFGLKYYVLNRASFGPDYRAHEGYVPDHIALDQGRTGKQILSSLVRIDVLNAQRHLADKSGAGNRAEDLSRHLSRYYSRNLDKREEDFDAMQALAESEKLLNEHLEKVFGPILTKLSELGYPEHPKLLIRSTLNPAAVMNSTEDGAKVHYVLNPGEAEPITLPDRYNGLGFKNLIYMVVELLDKHVRWLEIEEDRPPLHLLFIEEPEVHLHAQLQQVFIRKIMSILELEGEDASSCHNQFLITTHSPHILYERGFRPIRYFRRSPETQIHQSCEVLNLSVFYNSADVSIRDFLERYMKLTHCDLFFADAAILVEGNVERLLLPQMIEREARRLKAACLSIMEVGGAFAFRFRELIEFLGIPTLIITDIDSVLPSPATPTAAATVEAAELDEEDDGDEDATPKPGSACRATEPGAVTSNATLIGWLPKLTTIEALLGATPMARTQTATAANPATVRVVYQTPCAVEWLGQTDELTGRTLEESFGLQNLAWCQDMAQQDIRLRIPGNANKSLDVLAERLYKRVNSKSFKKTDFALALLTKEPNAWAPPAYIAQGLKWLEDTVKPEPPEEAAPAEAVQ